MLNINENTEVITSRPNMTFTCLDEFEQHLLAESPNQWPNQIIMMCDDGTRPVRVSVTMTYNPTTQAQFKYEQA